MIYELKTTDFCPGFCTLYASQKRQGTQTKMRPNRIGMDSQTQ
jgi:hypothetical protein